MLGEMLRDARQARGISLAQAERETKIRQKYISALEDDKLAELPGPVYARGFLRNYATYLGLDPEEVVDLFDEQSQPTRSKIRAARGEQVPVPGRTRNGAERINIAPLSPQPIDTRVRYGSSYITISLLAIPLIIAFYFIYSAYAPAARGDVQALNTVQPKPPTVTPLPATTVVVVSGQGGGDYNTPTVSVPLSPGPPQVLPPITSTVDLSTPASPIEVQIKTTRDVFVSVTVDGKAKYSGTLASGTTKTWTGKSTVRIRAGIGNAVRATVNGEDKGLMGTTRSIITKQWDSTGKETVVK